MNKNIFITGATGNIGFPLINLLTLDQGTNIIALLRARDEHHFSQRVQNLNKKLINPEQVKFVRGDVSCKILGLSEDDYQYVLSHSNFMIHAAADVKLNQTKEEAIGNVLFGTKEFVDLVESSEKIEKGIFVSTVGVAGKDVLRLTEERLVGERGFHNTYEMAKSKAEEYLYLKMDEGLPITIVRPSMVVGDSLIGKLEHRQVFYYLVQLLSGVKTFGFLPPLNLRSLDIIPVDFVCGAIKSILYDAGTAGQIFNLCSGPEESISLENLRSEVIRVKGERGEPFRPTIKTLKMKVWYGLSSLLGLLPFSGAKKTSRAIGPLLAYMETNQFFENAKTLKYLKEKGIELPRVRDYIEKVI